MAKIQTRRTISISGQAYRDFKAACQRNGVAMAALVQGWAEQYAARHSEDEATRQRASLRDAFLEAVAARPSDGFTARPQGADGMVFTTRPDAPVVTITEPKPARRRAYGGRLGYILDLGDDEDEALETFPDGIDSSPRAWSGKGST
jgi:hypothetical protein